MRSRALPLATVILLAVVLRPASATAGSPAPEAARRPPEATRPPPRVTVRHFLSLAHGLYRLSPEDRRTLAAMKAHPAPYVVAVRRAMPSVGAAVASDAALARLALGGALLGALGTPVAAELLARWYVGADRAERRARTRARRIRAFRLAASLLDDLGTTPKPALVAYLLARLVAMNPGPRAGALEYLARACAGDPEVRARLTRLIEAEGAPLHGDPTARAILAQMERGGPAR